MGAVVIGVLPSSQAIGLPAAAADVQSVTVSEKLQVYDGDTLEIGPLVIRLHGIDAPEAAQSCARPDGGA